MYLRTPHIFCNNIQFGLIDDYLSSLKKKGEFHWAFRCFFLNSYGKTEDFQSGGKKWERVGTGVKGLQLEELDSKAINVLSADRKEHQLGIAPSSSLRVTVVAVAPAETFYQFGSI